MRLRRTIAVFNQLIQQCFCPTRRRQIVFGTNVPRGANASRRKNCTQRKPAESGDAVFVWGQLYYTNEIILCSNAFSDTGNRSQRVVVVCRGGSRKTVRH